MNCFILPPAYADGANLNPMVFTVDIAQSLVGLWGGDGGNDTDNWTLNAYDAAVGGNLIATGNSVGKTSELRLATHSVNLELAGCFFCRNRERRYLFIANSTGSVGIPDSSMERSHCSAGLSEVFDLALLGVVLTMMIFVRHRNGVRFCYGFRQSSLDSQTRI